jgi:hypothetical protein
MNLYIPEIGDQIVLTEDWSFALHPERRNTDLAAYYGYYFKYDNPDDLWIDEAVLPKMREPDYYDKIQYPDPNKYSSRLFGFDRSSDMLNADRKKAEANCPEFIKYWEDHKEWNTQARKVGLTYIKVTLPLGTILGVDRIYIRKGNKDYSSVTFFAKNLGSVKVDISRWSSRKNKTVNKKAIRFWAKLEDVNQIEFEPVKPK